MHRQTPGFRQPQLTIQELGELRSMDSGELEQVWGGIRVGTGSFKTAEVGTPKKP